MAEYIERDALIDDLDAAAKHGGMGAIIAQTLQRYVKRAQVADVAPVRHGQWDGEGDGYADGELVIDVWYCSCCGHCIDDGTDDPTILPNYCPNCGARMDGARNGEEKD